MACQTRCGWPYAVSLRGKQKKVKHVKWRRGALLQTTWLGGFIRPLKLVGSITSCRPVLPSLQNVPEALPLVTVLRVVANRALQNVEFLILMSQPET